MALTSREIARMQATAKVAERTSVAQLDAFKKSAALGQIGQVAQMMTRVHKQQFVFAPMAEQMLAKLNKQQFVFAPMAEQMLAKLNTQLDRGAPAGVLAAATLLEKAMAELELAQAEALPTSTGPDIDPAWISWTVFVLVFAVVLQLYIAEANRTGEYLLDGNRDRLLFDLSAMFSSAYVAKKVTERVVRKILD